jgi:hypothetical protein
MDALTRLPFLQILNNLRNERIKKTFRRTSMMMTKHQMIKNEKSEKREINESFVMKKKEMLSASFV